MDGVKSVWCQPADIKLDMTHVPSCRNVISIKHAAIVVFLVLPQNNCIYSFSAYNEPRVYS